MVQRRMNSSVFSSPPRESRYSRSLSQKYLRAIRDDDLCIFSMSHPTGALPTAQTTISPEWDKLKQRPAISGFPFSPWLVAASSNPYNFSTCFKSRPAPKLRILASACLHFMIFCCRYSGIFSISSGFFSGSPNSCISSANTFTISIFTNLYKLNLLYLTHFYCIFQFISQFGHSVP